MLSWKKKKNKYTFSSSYIHLPPDDQASQQRTLGASVSRCYGGHHDVGQTNSTCLPAASDNHGAPPVYVHRKPENNKKKKEKDKGVREMDRN